MITQCLLFVAVLAAQIARVPTLVPPEKPVMVSTEIGVVETTAGKLQISVNATLTTNAIATTIQFREPGSPTPRIVLSPADVPAMLEILQQAYIKMSAAAPFAGKAGPMDARVIGAAGQASLDLRFDAEVAGGTRRQLAVDAKNAMLCLRLLAQAKQVSDWLAPKLKGLQPEELLY